MTRYFVTVESHGLVLFDYDFDGIPSRNEIIAIQKHADNSGSTWDKLTLWESKDNINLYEDIDSTDLVYICEL